MLTNVLKHFEFAGKMDLSKDNGPKDGIHVALWH